MVYLNAPSRRKFSAGIRKVALAGRKYGGAAASAVGAWAAKKYQLKSKMGVPVRAKPKRGRPRKVLAPYKAPFLFGQPKYTADPTNSISTSVSGGMTTHSMTVNIGSKKNILSKLVKSSKESWTLRFGAIQPYNNTTIAPINYGAMVGGGAYALPNLNSLVVGAVGAFSQYMPLHVFDLTSANNINLATPVYGTPMRELYFTGTCVAAGIYPTSTVEFGNVNGRTSDGVSPSPNWQMEKTTHPLSASYPLGSIMQEWTQIKMLCYGAKTFSTRFKIQVIQILEDDFHPLEISNWTAGIPAPPTAWDDVTAPINFWQGISAASYKHPIATVSTDYRKNIKVIKEYNFIVDPTTTIEERAEVGHSKALNIFVPMYRQNNYNSKAQANDLSLADSDNFGVDIDKNEAYLKPKARIYLIVQATNPYTVNSGGSVTPANTPSYDIVIRNKFSQLS